MGQQFLGAHTTYHPCACRGFQARTKHALRQTFVEYREDGATMLAYSRLSGIVAGLAVSAELVPRHVSSQEMAERGAIQLGAKLGLNVLREFSPELRRQLPESLRHRP